MIDRGPTPGEAPERTAGGGIDMTSLPIDPRIPEVLAALRDHHRLVLVASPGAGKTTRVPPAIVRAPGLLDPANPGVILLQPRRVAARSAAARIADESGWRLGREVGYQVRFERVAGPETRLLVATEGILTRRLVVDPFLEGTGAVILDEFHERSLHTDLALALVREVRESVRDDLRIVVMSATLDAGPVARFLGGCPILEVEGRAHPVEVRHAPASTAPLPERVAAAVERAIADPGDILIFLPGWEEIRRTARQLGPLADREGLLILPLHGSLPAEEQDRALRPADRRKVILATNVAETSLTIEGVRTVIDSGLVRRAGYDPERGLDRLELGRISRASATQRAGRAGRTAPGTCIRLWSAREDRGLEPFDQPEVRRADLAGTALTIHAWGHADLARFGWYESPPAEALDAADRLLARLDAIDAEGGVITPLGHRLLDLPVHPRLGRLLEAAAGRGLIREGASLAALLSEKDILATSGPDAGRDRPPGRGRSDLLRRLDLLGEAERLRFGPGARGIGVDPNAARQVARARDQLERIARRLPGARRTGSDDADEDDLLKLALVAYPDRLARRREGGGPTARMVGGRGVRLDPASIVRDAELFLALDPREDRRGGALEARVRVASEVRAVWLEELFPERLRRLCSVEFDEARGRAVAVQTLCFDDLPLREDRNAPVDPDEASAALARAVGHRARAFVAENKAASAWLGRVDFLRRHLPEEAFPEFQDDDLAESLVLACVGRRTLDELRRVPLVPIFRGRLTHAQGRLLDAEAPEAIAVPSGNRIRLEYPPEGPPVLAVRLQELFGWSDTPRLARGRVTVLLHLLGPNDRPVQITEDLRSFWTSAYFQARKDLRARYPKHAWPDDPGTALAEAKGGRRRS